MRLASLLGPDIKQILKEDPDQVRDLLDEIHAEDLADIISELEPDEAAVLLARMPAEDAAPIFERLDAQEQEDIAVEMPPASVAHIASEMASDDRADLFSVLPDDIGDQVLRQLETWNPLAAEEVREIEQWPETSAGHQMTTEFVKVSPGMSVGGALTAVAARARESDEFVYTAYVLEDDKLIGVVSLRDLITAQPSDRLSDIMTTNIIGVLPTEDQEAAARRMAKYDLNAMPVIDDQGRIRGVITIDDALDVLTAEQTEDVQKIGGISPLENTYFQTSFLDFIKKRAVWLIILFFGGFFTNTALRHYDEVLKSIFLAQYYIPLLISAGGNSGSQSSTLIIRGLAIGEIQAKDWWRVLLRELAMGLTLGSILGVIGFVRVIVLDHDMGFAVAVSLTLVGISLAGCTVGAMIPIILKRIGLDPATSSTPFIASLVDVLGIIVFMNVAQYVIGTLFHAL